MVGRYSRRIANARTSGARHAQPRHQSYLLRLWREQPKRPARHPRSRSARPEAHQHFADLDALYAFLCAQADANPDLNDDRNTTYCTPLESS